MERIGRFVVKTLLIAMMLFSVALLLASFLTTAKIGIEGVIFEKDNPFLNILASVLSISLVYLVYKLIEDMKLRTLLIVLVSYTLAVGIFIISIVKLHPSGDEEVVANAAWLASQGSFSGFGSFFEAYPNRLGYAFCMQCFFSVMRTLFPNVLQGYCYLALEMLNVCCMAVSFFAVVQSTALLFREESAAKLTAMLMLPFLPAIFACTRLSAGIPAYMFATLAVWMHARFMRSHDFTFGALSAVFIGVAVCLKFNSLVFLAVIAIVWVFDLFKQRRLTNLLCLALALGCIWLLLFLPKQYYKMKTGGSFEGGIPIISQLAIGMGEGSMCSGWDDGGETYRTFVRGGMSSDVSTAAAKEKIRERSAVFSADFAYTLRFLGKKLISQWNEPGYQTISDIRSGEHYSETGMLYDSIFNKSIRFTERLLNTYLQLILFGVSVGLLALIRRESVYECLFAAVVLLAALYHLIFEARAEFALAYIIMLIPISAFGYICMTDWHNRRNLTKAADTST